MWFSIRNPEAFEEQVQRMYIESHMRSSLISIIILVMLFQSEALAGSRAFFEIGFRGRKETQIIKLRDQNKIEEARAFLRSKSSAGVMGEIIKYRASYNPSWSYHLKPSSIKFFELAIEVCDASPKYIEKHLNKVGSDFLPGKIWCPWSSYLRKEIRGRRRF